MAKQETATKSGSFLADVGKTVVKTQIVKGSTIAIERAIERYKRNRHLTDEQVAAAEEARVRTIIARVIDKCERKGISDEGKIDRMVSRRLRRERFWMRYHRVMRGFDRVMGSVARRMNLRKMEARWEQRIARHQVHIMETNDKVLEVHGVVRASVRQLPSIQKLLEEQREKELKKEQEDREKKEMVEADSKVVPAPATP